MEWTGETDALGYWPVKDSDTPMLYELMMNLSR